MCALAGSNWAMAQNLNSEPRQVPSGKLSSQLGKPAATQDNEAVDGIAAVVNSDIITKSELNRQVALIERQMQRKGTPLPDRRALQEQILNRMVMDRAQLQLAKETGIRVEDNQIESTILAGGLCGQATGTKRCQYEQSPRKKITDLQYSVPFR